MIVIQIVMFGEWCWLSLVQRVINNLKQFLLVTVTIFYFAVEVLCILLIYQVLHNIMRVVDWIKASCSCSVNESDGLDQS